MGDEDNARAALVAETLSELVGRPTGAPMRLIGGFANETWLVDVGDQRLLVRVARPDADPTKVRAAWRAHQLAFEGGVRTGRPMVYVARCAALENRAARVVEFVEGTTDGPVADPARFFASLGEELARLHRIALPGFSSRVDGSAEVFDTWGEYVAYRIPAVKQRVVASGALSVGEADAALAGIATLAEQVSGVVAPVLTHRDLHLGNVVIDPDGQLRAVLDWDGAEGWDPVVDLVKLRWQVFGAHRGASDALLAAYENAVGTPSMLRERLAVVDALELTNAIANARMDGYRDYEAHNRRALAVAIAER